MENSNCGVSPPRRYNALGAARKGMLGALPTFSRPFCEQTVLKTLSRAVRHENTSLIIQLESTLWVETIPTHFCNIYLPWDSPSEFPATFLFTGRC